MKEHNPIAKNYDRCDACSKTAIGFIRIQWCVNKTTEMNLKMRWDKISDSIDQQMDDSGENCVHCDRKKTKFSFKYLRSRATVIYRRKLCRTPGVRKGSSYLPQLHTARCTRALCRDLLVWNSVSAKCARIQTQRRLQGIPLHHTVHVVEAGAAIWWTSARIGRRVRRRIGWSVRWSRYQRNGIGVGSRCTLITVSAVRFCAIDQVIFLIWTIITVICVMTIFDVIGSMYCPAILPIRLVEPASIL